MVNPMITVDDQIAVRANEIRAIEVRGESVVVYCNCVGPFNLWTSDVSGAHELRNRLLSEIKATDKEHDSATHDVDYGLPQVGLIVDLLQQVFGERLNTVSFRNDLWLALQVIYGSEGAARYANDCLNPLSRVM